MFTLGVKAGVEPLALFRALRQGATGRKRTFDRLAEHFLPGVYDPPAFTVRLAHKDMKLALELAEQEVPMRVGKVALDELDEAMRRGWGERDCRVAMTLQEERAGVSVRVPRAARGGARLRRQPLLSAAQCFAAADELLRAERNAAIRARLEECLLAERHGLLRADALDVVVLRFQAPGRGARAHAARLPEPFEGLIRRCTKR